MSLPPEMLAVSVVPYARLAEGVNVTVRVLASYAFVPATAPPGPVTVATMVAGCTGSENWAWTVELTGAMVAPSPGFLALALGGATSGPYTADSTTSTPKFTAPPELVGNTAPPRANTPLPPSTPSASRCSGPLSTPLPLKALRS